VVSTEKKKASESHNWSGSLAEVEWKKKKKGFKQNRVKA